MTTRPDSSDLGFRIVSGALDPAETSRLLRRLEASQLTRSRAGARHLMKHSAVSDVANDPRLFAIARGFLGSSTVPFRATLFDTSSARNWLVTWHQDIALPLTPRHAGVGSVVDKVWDHVRACAGDGAVSRRGPSPALRRFARGQRASACLEVDEGLRIAIA